MSLAIWGSGAEEKIDAGIFERQGEEMVALVHVVCTSGVLHTVFSSFANP